MGLAKKLIIVVVAIPVLIVGGSYIRNKGAGPEGWAMDNTTMRLKEHFKDPASMVVKSSRTIATAGPGAGVTTIHICGLVDGKNSFGAYAGPVRFVSRSVTTEDTFDTYAVDVEDPTQTAAARDVNMRSGFEKMTWDPHCEGSSKTT